MTEFIKGKIYLANVFKSAKGIKQSYLGVAEVNGYKFNDNFGCIQEKNKWVLVDLTIGRKTPIQYSTFEELYKEYKIRVDYRDWWLEYDKYKKTIPYDTQRACFQASVNQKKEKENGATNR